MLFEQVQLAGVPLTTNIDTINVEGHAVNTVTGLSVNSATTQTWNTGDTINGNNLTKVALVGNGTLAAGASVVTLNNVASVDVNLVLDTEVVASEFNNVAQVAVTSGISGKALTLTDADNLSTVYALSNAGRQDTINVNWTAAAVEGKADTALVAANSTGLKGSLSTINVSNGNGIETVQLATSGTNYLNVNGGTGAKTITVTGSGTNNITVTGANGALLLDASETTGDQTLTVTGYLSGTNDTILGGSGDDTVVAAISATTVATITDIETLDLSFAAAQTFDGKNVTGATTLNVAGAGAATFNNLASSVQNIGFLTNNTGNSVFNYASGTNADVDVTVGVTTTAGTGTTALTLGTQTFANNAGSVSISSIADKTTTLNTVGNVALGTATGLSLDAAGAKLTVGDVTGTKVTSLNAVSTAGALIMGTFAAADALASINLDAAAGNLNTGLISADSSLTAITLNAGTTSAGADAAVTTSVGKSATAAATAVNATLTVTGEGDANFTSNGADTYISAVDASASTGSVNVNLSAYTGTSATTVTLGNAGAADSNTIQTGSGADVITGGTGADSIWGNKGADVISGGAGVDTFNYHLGATTAAVAQLSTLTPTGLATGETLVVNLGGVNYSQAFTVDVETTLGAFVTAYEAAIETAMGATSALAATATTLTFTGPTNGTSFTAPTGSIVGTGSVAVVTTDGSAAATTASDSNLTTLDLLTYVSGTDLISLVTAGAADVTLQAAADEAAAVGHGAITSNATGGGLYTKLGGETTLALTVAGAAAAIAADATGTQAGDSVVFVFEGQAYAYLSDAVDGYSANGDVVISLTGISSLSNGLAVTTGDISLIS